MSHFTRLIPAGAGNTRTAQSYHGNLYGSSPLARGTLFFACPAGAFHRFIPAGAGNTSSRVIFPAAPTGSSPLARGTRCKTPASAPGRRFIPAGAGNTDQPSTSCCSIAVHPRWRGEHFRCWGIGCDIGGSSPLARGTPHSAQSWATQRRFIPAGAGNTPKLLTVRVTKTVHPRWRGEHLDDQWIRAAKVGSSPLARGTR